MGGATGGWGQGWEERGYGEVWGGPVWGDFLAQSPRQWSREQGVGSWGKKIPVVGLGKRKAPRGEAKLAKPEPRTCKTTEAGPSRTRSAHSPRPRASWETSLHRSCVWGDGVRDALGVGLWA